MSHLISNFSPTAEIPFTNNFQTLLTYNLDQETGWSITLEGKNFEANSLNAKHIETLEKIETLSDNWDQEGSLVPPQKVTSFARAIIYLMNAIGQEMYNIAPGPNGEIMLDFSNNKRSFEILIYPDKMMYVKFPEQGNPIQDSFTPEKLYTDLLSWLNT